MAALPRFIMFLVVCRRYLLKVKKAVQSKFAFAKYSASKQTSLEGFEFPFSFREWKQHWGNCIRCCFCTMEAISDVKYCKFCGNIAHRLCILSRCQQQGFTRETYFHGREYDSIGTLLNDRFVCPTCEESKALEDSYYKACYEKLKAQKCRKYHLDTITRFLSTCLSTRRHQKMAKALNLLRGLVRKRIDHKLYQFYRRSVLRVIFIQLNSLPSYMDSSSDRQLIVLTVVDPVKHAQLFRFDKRADLAFQEGRKLYISFLMCITLYIVFFFKLFFTKITFQGFSSQEFLDI